MSLSFVAGSTIALVVIIAAILLVEECLYNKNMLAKKVPYRLPLGCRLRGWLPGSDFTSGMSANGMFYDKRIGKNVPVHKLGSWVFQRIFG